MSVTISNGVITLGSQISLNDLPPIYALLGVEPTDGKTYDVKGVCLADTINRYSLIKPTYTTNPRITAANLPSWNPTNADNCFGYGVTLPQLILPASYSAFTRSYWQHKAPTAVADNYGCLRHFDGYFHYATGYVPLWVDCEAGAQIVVSVLPGDLDGKTLNIANIAKSAKLHFSKTLYMGVALYKGGSLQDTFTSPSPIYSDDPEAGGTEANVLELGIAAENTTYVFVPFLTDNPTKGTVKTIYSASVSSTYSGIKTITTDVAPAVTCYNIEVIAYRAGSFDLRVYVDNPTGKQQSVTDAKFVGNINGHDVEVSLPTKTLAASPSEQTLVYTISNSFVTPGASIYGEWSAKAAGKVVVSPWMGDSEEAPEEAEAN